MDNSLIKESNSKSRSLQLKFDQLCYFADFLLENQLDDFVKLQLSYSREENVPILKFLKHFSEEELFELAKGGAIELLQAIRDNTADKYIELNTKNYEENIIPYFESEFVLSEDITSISLVRRKSFRKFIPQFSTDPQVQFKILDELDRFLAASETSSYNAMLNIQQKEIKKVNLQLANKHHDLLEAQKLADMGSYVWNIAEETSEFTKGVMDILELGEGKPNFENFIKNVHEEDRDLLKTALGNSMKGEIFNCEFRYLVNNNLKYLWSRGLVDFSEGKAVSLKGTIMDISHKRRILDKLQKSEDLNKLAQALTHIGNWSWDIASNLIHWSDEMYRIYGMEPQSEQISFAKFLSFVHEDDREKRKVDIERSLKTHVAEDYIMRIVDAKGELKILKGKGDVIVDSNNIPLRLVGTCQDITKEHELHRKIEEKEEYLDQLIMNAPDSIVVKNEEGKITLWNPKAEEMFGWQAKEVMGKSFSKTLIPAADLKSYQKNVSALIRAGSPKIYNRTIELNAISKNNKALDVSMTVSRLVQRGSNLFIIFIRDISVEKRNKEELKAKSLELQKANASLHSKNFLLKNANQELESFNYIASHDLQEPLRKIQTFANRIVEDEKYQVPDNVSVYIDKILFSASKMKSLITDLLRFSHSTQKMENFQAVDLNQILEEVKESLSTSIDQTKAVVYSDNLPRINAVPFQMHQLLLNILGNAIKYSKSDVAPKIKISHALLNGSAIDFPLAVKSADYHHLKIVDNGLGFEAKDAAKIFELFKRLHNKNFSGNGVGLAICKKIVNNHNGFISAEGSLGTGSTFNIYLPCQ